MLHRILTMPLRRYIFNTLTVVSLLLLLAVVGLWVDSYWHYASIVHMNEMGGT